MNKKGFFISVAALLLLLASCASEQNKYEQIIADYVQTDRHGTWTDLKFKAISVEVSNFTVADSLQILKEQFEAKRDEQIASQEKTLAYFQSLLNENQSAKHLKQAVDDQLSGSIANVQHRIDSLRNLQLEYNARYADRETTEVAAIVVTCRYSYAMPGTNTEQQKTEIFILSPDGNRVIQKKGIR